MLSEILREQYALETLQIEKTQVGAGSDTYFVTCKGAKYVVKFPCQSEMNNPSLEPALCEFLIKMGLRVSEFIKNLHGTFISADKTGRPFHVQKFVAGDLYDWHTALPWLLKDTAQTLGKIHTALSTYDGLPAGLGKEFFRFMSPTFALSSYQNTYKTALEKGDGEIAEDLLYRISLLEKFPAYQIDLDRLTCQSTHGDYFISQLICKDNRISAVIDWTTACVHPVAWEIMRSYVYASPSCISGQLNTPEFIAYLDDYLLFAPLNQYDIEMMGKLFYYQISVCDYYNQFYSSCADNRDIYLRQAKFSTKLMKWFEHNLSELTETLARRYFS